VCIHTREILIPIDAAGDMARVHKESMRVFIYIEPMCVCIFIYIESMRVYIHVKF